MSHSDPDLIETLQCLSASDRQALMEFLGDRHLTPDHARHLMDTLRASMVLHRKGRDGPPN
ncbi:hypothetical protein [Aliiroseovarius subalbicans]|uniref:hypothetical protein n=1 Tax=Aliiroseovarius subalbicans TaxID=2925840 RepID=UPI001F5A587B|nr:hypothetical protein [Aliiroseovarius subalbicans]MCI2401091.1 hypothetical protein [Aliiroseovarius subalbicans]